MASIGHPCIADSSYGRRDALFLRDLGATEDPLIPDPQQPILMRQALHAYNIQFTHPGTGMIVDYTAPLADDLELVLTLLRKYKSKDKPPPEPAPVVEPKPKAAKKPKVKPKAKAKPKPKSKARAKAK
jgi:outer membrane biosynthesis protein TonB